MVDRRTLQCQEKLEMELNGYKVLPLSPNKLFRVSWNFLLCEELLMFVYSICHLRLKNYWRVCNAWWLIFYVILSRPIWSRRVPPLSLCLVEQAFRISQRFSSVWRIVKKDWFVVWGLRIIEEFAVLFTTMVINHYVVLSRPIWLRRASLPFLFGRTSF
jgi:hypothetical protein